MATNLKIDDSLLNEAVQVSGLPTKRETVNQALREFVQRRRQLKVLELAGTIDFDPDYDHRVQRNRP
jgi:Arc/MetJ family transcription regulator